MKINVIFHTDFILGFYIMDRMKGNCKRIEALPEIEYDYLLGVEKMKKRVMMTAAAIVLTGCLLAGCSNTKKTEVKESALATETLTTNNVEEETGSAPEEKLINEENSIFTEHNDVWEKVFSQIDKEKAAADMEEGKSYLEFINDSVAQVRESLSDDEKIIIDEDLKRIEEIENQLSELQTEGEQK